MAGRYRVPPVIWRRWFYGDQGLRAGWCLLRFVVVYVLLATAGGWVRLWLAWDPRLETGWVPRSFGGGARPPGGGTHPA
jgi:hypothetical protein